MLKSDYIASEFIHLLLNNIHSINLYLSIDETKKTYTIYFKRDDYQSISVSEYTEHVDNVYDIEVMSDNHTFIDSFGCIGVHNSDIYKK